VCPNFVTNGLTGLHPTTASQEGQLHAILRSYRGGEAAEYSGWFLEEMFELKPSGEYAPLVITVWRPACPE